MINNNKTNDWFTSILFNQDKDTPDFIAAGLNKDNTGLLSREFYKNKSRVQLVFSDLDGKFDEVAYNQFYNSSLRTYNDFILTQLEDNFIDDQIFSDRDIDIDPNKNRRKYRFDVIPVKNPMNLTTGTTSLFGQSESDLSTAELALTLKIGDGKGGFLDYTPNDAGGRGIQGALKRIGNAVLGPTLALASWDEDGEHQLEDGRTVKHSKGDLKYNSNDMPYYDILGDKSPYGKTILHVTDVLTVDGSTANKFDFFDSDSKEKSVIGTTMKFVASLAPIVIKGTRTPYAYLTAAHSFGSALSGMFKAADEWLEGGDTKERSTTWKTLNNFESFLKRFDSSVSEESQSKMLGWENFSNMLSDIVLQLYQQRAVANLVLKTPKWLSMTNAEMDATKRAMVSYGPQYVEKYGKTIAQAIKDGDLAADFRQVVEISKAAERFRRMEKLGKRGADLSKMYMAITQSGGMVETMDEAGFTPEAKVIGTLAALYGFKKIFDSELGDVALKGFGFDDISNTTRKFFLENVGAIERQIAEKTGQTALSKTAQLSLAKRIGSKLHKAYRWGMDHPNEYLGASFKEAAEEVSEELLQDGILNSLSVLDNAFRVQGENTYDFFETNPTERYLMSALGGALGGPIFTGIDKMERGVWGVHKSADPDTRAKLLQYIRNGLTQEVLSSLDKIIKGNKSGLSTSLSAKLAEGLSEDGKPYFLPSESESDSQAWILGENIKGWVQTVDATINNEGYAIKDDAVVFKALAQNARLDALMRTGLDIGILNDFKHNLNNLLDAKLAQSDESNGAQQNASLSEKYNTAKQNLDTILNGERADYYTKKLAFMMSRMINSSFIDADIEMYAQARGINYNALSEDSKVKLRAEYDQVKGSTDEQMVYDWSEIAFKSYQNMEKVIGPALSQFADNYALDPITGQLVLDQNFTNTVKELQEVFPTEREELSKEERAQILEKYRGGKTDEDILLEMNPSQVNLSEIEKKDLIDRYLSNNKLAAQEIEGMTAANWIVKTFGKQALNPESLKYGLDSIVMLKTREELRQTLANIRMIMLKYNTNYIDSRTNDSLLKMEKALNNVDFKNIFKIWSQDNSSGVPNIMRLLVDNGIENFTYTTEAEEDGDIFEVEGEATLDTTTETTWTLRREYDSDGQPMFSETGVFTAVSDEGAQTQITLSEISDIIYDRYLKDVNNISDFLKAGQNAANNVTANINGRTANPAAVINHTIGDYLISDLYNDLGLDFQDRMQLITESEDLRRRVLKNPIYEALRKSSELILGVGEDVFTLIQREEEEIGKRSSLEDYVLSDLVKGERLAKSFMFLQAFKNIINGKVKNTTDFDFNDTIDHFLAHYKKLTPELIKRENPTLSIDIAAIINRDIDGIAEKLRYLIQLDMVNNSSKFQDSAKSQVKMNSLMIKVLTGQLGNKFGFILNAQINGEPFFNFSELEISTEDMEKINSYTKSDSKVFNDEAIHLTEEVLTKIKQYIYNKFNSDLIDDSTREVLLIQMMDGLNLNVKEQRIDQNMDNDKLNPFTAFSVLLSTISSDPVKFRTLFTEEIGELIPYSMQMFNSEVMCAYADNNKWFATAMNEVNNNISKYFPGNEKAAASNESFSNVLFSWGNAGAGKTVFLANMVAKQFIRNNKNANIWVAGPNQDRATNLTAATGVQTNYDRTALFKLILTPEAFAKYERMMSFISENRDKVDATINNKVQSLYAYHSDQPIMIGDVTLAKNVKQLASDYITAQDVIDKPDLLIIDEITKFDTFELLILDRAGIKVIALGDRSQVSSRLFGKPHNPDGIYMNTAELAMSVRTTNIHKKDNHSRLGATMNVLLDQFLIDQRSDLTEQFNREKSLTTFTYNEVEEDGKYILNGEKMVQNLNVFMNSGEARGTVEGLVRGLDTNEQIVYIHNPGGNSSSYSEMESLARNYPGKVEFKTLDEVQGKEYKYAIVDINYTELFSVDNIYKNDELLDALKEFNTAASRSMDGTIIVDNDSSPYHIENFAERGYTNKTGDSKSDQAVEYSKRIINIIIDTTPNSNSTPINNEEVSSGQQVDQTVTEIEQEEVERPEVNTTDFIANNAYCGTFYNHLSIDVDGNTYNPSGLREDLGIFEIRNKEEFEKYKNGLSYLRSYIITSKITKKPITSEDFGNIRKSSKFSDITRKLVGNNVGKLYKALNDGVFLIKLTDSKNSYSQTYDSVTKDSLNPQSETLGRIVYQIKDQQGEPYDITIGAVSSDYVQSLLDNGKMNGTKIAKPEGNSSIYFSFSEQPEWTINSMKPLTRADGFDVTNNLPLRTLRDSHPEIFMSEPLLARKGKNKGRPFVIYSYNLFENPDTEALAELRERELNRKGSNPDTNMTTSVLYLNRIGYTVDEWMNKFDDFMRDEVKRDNLGYITGYMTSARFVASMIDFYNLMPAGEMKDKLGNYLSGRVQSELFSSKAIGVSKTLENIDKLDKWIRDNKDNAELLRGWLDNGGDSKFNEEKFLKSSQLIAETVKSSKNIVATLTSIKESIIKGSDKYGEITPEIIDTFIAEVNNLKSDLSASAIAKKPNSEDQYISKLVYEWLSNGILVKASRMKRHLFDIHRLWKTGTIKTPESPDGEVSYFTKDEFQSLFREIINNSQFYNKNENGESMIYIEGKAYRPNHDKDGLISDSYYFDSNPEENFTVNANIQLPSVYFRKANTVNLEAFSTQKQVEQTITQIAKPTTAPTSLESIKSRLISMQSGNVVWDRAINRVLSDSSRSPEEIYDDLDAMVKSPNVTWKSKIDKINGKNQVYEKPEIILRNGEVIINESYTPLKSKYTAVSNDSKFDLDAIDITEFRSIRDFDFTQNGIPYRFSGSDNGSFTAKSTVQVIDEATLNTMINDLEAEGELFGLEQEFKEVADILRERYADISRFNEDADNSNTTELYQLIIPAGMNPDAAVAIIDSLESKFRNIKCE